MDRTYYLWTIGCQMNEADARRLAAQLEARGYLPCSLAEQASVVVLNTCVVRQQAEDRVLRRLAPLAALKRRKPQTTIAVMGCLVGRREEASLRDRFPWVDVFAPPSDLQPLLDHLEEAHERERERERAVCGEAAAMEPGEEPVLPRSQRDRAVTAQVPVVLGCSCGCAYCVIPGRRGRERSRPAEEILDEVRRLAEQGVREVTLLGQIVDRYGLDRSGSPDLAALLQRVAAVPGLLRVRFLTSHPRWMSDRLFEAVAESAILCPCFEVPVQSGNDEVLARMRRNYTVDEYRRLIGRLRARVPNAAIATDIIVGFPGETEAQFMDSFRLIEELRLDIAHIARYSERPGTPAAGLYPDDVPEAEKQRRWAALEELQTRIQEEENARLLGGVVDVLAERCEKNGRWRGRTPQNKLVFFEDDREPLGRVVPVELTWTGPFTLIGHAAGRIPEGDSAASGCAGG